MIPGVTKIYNVKNKNMFNKIEDEFYDRFCSEGSFKVYGTPDEHLKFIKEKMKEAFIAIDKEFFENSFCLGEIILSQD